MLTQKIKNEIKNWALDSIECGQIENDYTMIKAILSEDYPELTEQDLNEGANIYTKLTW